MELSSTAKVILGMLRMRPRSGYEIKGFVDKSTSFFYSAGFGSIYPELKRLREASLIAGTEDPAGDRRRVTYRLTPAGEEALERWLDSDPAPIELRDEALLQLFFAKTAEQAAAALDAKAAIHADTAERLGGMEEPAATLDSPYPHLTLRSGLAYNRSMQEWCEREAARLRRRGGKEKKGSS